MKSLIYFTVGLDKQEEDQLSEGMQAALKDYGPEQMQLIECDRLTMDFWFRTKMQEKTRMGDAAFIKDLFEEKPEMLEELKADLDKFKATMEDQSAEFGYFDLVEALGHTYPFVKNMMKVCDALGFVSKVNAKNKFVFVDTTELAHSAVINKIEGLKQSLQLMERLEQVLAPKQKESE